MTNDRRLNHLVGTVPAYALGDVIPTLTDAIGISASQRCLETFSRCPGKPSDDDPIKASGRRLAPRRRTVSCKLPEGGNDEDEDEDK